METTRTADDVAVVVTTDAWDSRLYEVWFHLRVAWTMLRHGEVTMKYSNLALDLDEQDDELLGGYHCVFVGRPHLCTPYAMFSSAFQAQLFNETMGGRYELMRLDEWRQQYEPDSEQNQ